MLPQISIYNTISKKKEIFIPIKPLHIGMYVCGPTVYGDPHLGHARPAITFDLLFRYFKYLGYKVRYIRNITDVGHLVNDADEGDDKIAAKARIEQLEPMEIAQYYTNRYHKYMDMLNVERPSIEPKASGHIIEQQEMIQQILDNGYAYEVNGSVYFDVEKYNKKHNYGKLSGRVVEDLLSNTRTLDGQSDKKNPFDFALWKKADATHIMRWKSTWSDGYPGWHVECSAMGMKYLGLQFDIHGGGMDLLFPHHECEIAQSVAANGQEAVKYWMHNNMITINGQKMGKSLNNFITLSDFISGEHKYLEQAYSPMTIRFFILQAHYRNPVDFSNAALQAAEKGLQRLLTGIHTLNELKPNSKSDVNVAQLKKKCFDALNDDFNTPILISHLFDGVRTINSIKDDNLSINTTDLDELKKLYNDLVFIILGLKDDKQETNSDNKIDDVVNLLLNIRLDAKKNKDFATSDKIRNELTEIGFTIKDTKEGFEWT